MNGATEQSTENLRAQLEECRRELESAVARFQNVIEKSADGIIIVDLDGMVRFANPAAERLFARPEAELRGRPFGFPLVVGETAEIDVLRPDGAVAAVEMRVTATEWDSAAAYLAALRDVTERKRLEEQVRRAQRLETAGRIAGQVAHDFNNLLQPLISYPSLIKRRLPEGHPAAQHCDTMVRAAKRMAAINDELLTLGRRGHFERAPLQLNQLVEQAVQVLTDLPPGVQLDLRLAPDLLPVSGSEAQLLRVVSNLVSNALDAIGDAGRLTLSTENVYVHAPTGRFNRIQAGEYVLLQVSDTGDGIPEEITDQIFDPFFTTKRADQHRGTGLGLTVVQALVEDHSGYLDLESIPGRGTTFSIYLPVSRGAPGEQLQEEADGGGECIVVVDDDETQRTALGDMLEALGYRVRTAGSGEEAISVLRADGSADLLVLDMVMAPGMDGAETYRRALEVRPGLRAVIVSGYSESDRVRETRALGAGAYVRKPVTLESLAQAVREELDRPS